MTKKQVDHEISKIAETAAKTSLIGVQKQGQSLQNQFDSATFGNRVKTVESTLFNLIYNGSGTLGTVRNMVARAASEFGVSWK